MTKKLYFSDSYLFSAQSRFLRIFPATDQRKDGATHGVVLESTIFHPQGGGQLCDVGSINDIFIVTDVRIVDGDIVHWGRFGDYTKQNQLTNECMVSLQIDEDRRRLNARLHSAGHLIDIAMHRSGVDLEPGQGMHTPSECWVEYKGVVEEKNIPILIATVNEQIRLLLEDNSKVVAEEYEYDSAVKACGGSLPSYIPAHAMPRVVVLVESEPGCPCGGTHVKRVSEIGKLSVTAIRCKRQVTKVSYDVK